jgi:hypothetical protein
MDYRTKTVDLPKDLPHSAGLSFLRAIVFEQPRLPFAIVNYAIDGEEHESGLRLDLGKRVFLDHFEEAGREQAASDAAMRIVSFLASEYQPKTPVHRAQGAD